MPWDVYLYRWPAPDAAAQAAAPPTPTPVGAGTILVRSLSGPDSERHALVFGDNDQSRAVPTPL